jgi:hypothetical protein
MNYITLPSLQCVTSPPPTSSPAPAPCEVDESDPHVVEALVEAKAALRKPSFGGGVRSVSRAEDGSSRSSSRSVGSGVHLMICIDPFVL